MSVRCDIWKGQSWALISDSKTAMTSFQGSSVLMHEERSYSLYFRPLLSYSSLSESVRTVVDIVLCSAADPVALLWNKLWLTSFRLQEALES